VSLSHIYVMAGTTQLAPNTACADGGARLQLAAWGMRGRDVGDGHGFPPHQPYAALDDQRELGPGRHPRLDAVGDAAQAGAGRVAARTGGTGLQCNMRRSQGAGRV